jgi:hypothetical protein
MAVTASGHVGVGVPATETSLSPVCSPAAWAGAGTPGPHGASAVGETWFAAQLSSPTTGVLRRFGRPAATASA